MNVIKTLFSFALSLIGIVLCLPILVLVLPFLMVRIFTNAVIKINTKNYLRWADLIEYNPNIGWKAKAKLNTRHMVDDVFTLTTDNKGWRGKNSIENSEILVFGDSFAWGYGIDDKNYFGNLDSELRIKAIGTVGYNMVQEFLCMQELAGKLDGKEIIWLIYHGNDLLDNICPDMSGYRTPFLRKDGHSDKWEITTSHIKPDRWPLTPVRRLNGWHYMEALGELCGPSYLSERAYDASRYMIEKVSDYCIEENAKLTIISLCDKNQLEASGQEKLKNYRKKIGGLDTFDENYPDKKIGTICKELNIPFVAISQHMNYRHYKEDDGHWNEKGHKKFAELITQVTYQ